MAGTSPAMTKGFMPGHANETYCLSPVMPALVAGIHVLTTSTQARVLRMEDASIVV
jgi:hypothetical protein